MAKRGRRDKLTPAVEEAILEGIRLGLTYEVACRAAGIDVSTLWRWRQQGEEAKSGKFYDFCKAVDAANAEAEALLLGRVVAASKEPQHWHAAKWILETRFRDRYGKAEKLVIDFSALDDEQLKELAEGGALTVAAVQASKPD